MDRLSALFHRFAPSVRVFQSGRLHQATRYPDARGCGHLHLLKSGSLSMQSSDGAVQWLREPHLLFFPRPCRHGLQPDPVHGAELFCAAVDLSAGGYNPLADALPEMMQLPLSQLPSLRAAVELLFAEGLGMHCGRQAALDRLMEYVLILLLRHLLDTGQQSTGLLAAWADPKLARAVTAMHERPEYGWTLETLASEAGMSRSRFALHFREAVAMTPMQYLTRWRLNLAQSLILQGKPMKSVAAAVGYQSAPALNKVFTQKLGLAPQQWRKQKQLSPQALTDAAR